MAFNINTSAHIKLTTKLGSMHKSVLPISIRETLNDTAIEAKRLIPKMADRKFTTRNKTFFKSFSSVDKAKGFNVNGMVATVGILPNKDGKGSKISKGLEKQETGGSIHGRKLIPHDKGRTSGSHSKRLKKKHQFGKIKIGDARNRNRNKSINYLLIKKGGKGTVFEIKKTGKKQKLTPVYSYRNTKVSRVEKSPFMHPASFIALKRMDKIYIKRAKKQVERELKRNR